MSRRRSESLLKPKLLAVSVAACFALNAGVLRANPTGPTVVHGSVGFSGLGTSALTITNQSGGNAIINWNGFSIGAEELTRFTQFANLAVLNRVTGTEISSILGALQSDGRVFLINPNGIVFGASAQIDVAGLVASSLHLSDQDFLGGRLRFTEVPGAGAVVNNGVIRTSAGGQVYLVAPSVENHGLVHTPEGAVVLAAGKDIELLDPASPFVTVRVASGEEALNVGSLVAEGGQIGMFGALVRNAGVIEANGVSVGPGGEIRLVASQDLTLEASSVVTANGASGGSVLLQAEEGTNLIDGVVEAKGSAGQGGEIHALGVRVGVVGHGVIDASGDTGGGTVLVGGDYKGGNAEVQNAERTYIGSDGVIRADAMTTGDGGRVIVWADGDTRFFGSISARGGSESGNGGFVETSGKQVLQAFGNVDVGAANGAGGMWLLDPEFIRIVAGAGADDGGLLSYGSIFFFDPPSPGESQVSNTAIASAMSNFGFVSLQATADVNFDASVNTSASPGTFEVLAYGNINLGSQTITTGYDFYGGVILRANYDGVGGGAITSTMPFGSTQITTNGGSVWLVGEGVRVAGINTSSTDAGEGYVSIFSTGNGNLQTGSIVTRSLAPGHSGGYVYLDAAYGSITVNGGIDTRGANGDNNRAARDGSGGGYVYLYAPSGAVSLTGAINTSGGNGVAGDSSGDGWGGSGGSGGDVDIYGATVTTASITTRGGNGGVGGTFSLNDPTFEGGDSWWDVSGGSGGWGGDIYLEAWSGALSVNGTIDASGGSGAAGGTANVNISALYGFNWVDVYADGGNGGGGGWIDLYGSTISTQAIVSRGGAGGAGGSATLAVSGPVQFIYADASGGRFGSGGEVYADASGAISTGTIDVRGGAGGIGGAASATLTSSSTTGYAESYARGGDGGEGGFVELYSSSGSVSTGSIFALGGSGARGGTATAVSNGAGGATSLYAYARSEGGHGAPGGGVFIETAGNVSVASIDARSGSGGQGGTASAQVTNAGSGVTAYSSADAEGGSGGDGGEFYYSYGAYVTIYGNVISTGSIVASGSNGGTGGTASASVSGAAGYINTNSAASGGGGSSGGYVSLYGSNSVTASGGIDVRGGSGAFGGTASTSASTSYGAAATVYATSESYGGYGGGQGGGSGGIQISGPTIGVTTLAALGGNGGVGGSATTTVTGDMENGYAWSDASGGGGGNGYYVSLYSDLGTVTGQIDVRGGSGAQGGAASTTVIGSTDYTRWSYSYGGSGRWGGSVYVSSLGPVTLGPVIASGGPGASGGSATVSPGGNAWSYAEGGYGGDGGEISVYASAGPVTTGALFANGGNGGNGGSEIGGGDGGEGGDGGRGGEVYVYSGGIVQINVGGTLGAMAIDVSGGAGGAGAPAASPAGDGGSGGGGGYVDILATPDMTLYGSVSAAGGAGGAGGAAGGGFPAGYGGSGGYAGGIYLDASSSTGSQTGDGIIYVLAGTQFNVQGGTGGIGSITGSAGITGTFEQNSDYFGTIIVLDPLSVPEINQAYQQIVEAGDDTTNFVGGEQDRDEDEDKSQKELGSCKG